MRTAVEKSLAVTRTLPEKIKQKQNKVLREAMGGETENYVRVLEERGGTRRNQERLKTQR